MRIGVTAIGATAIAIGVTGTGVALTPGAIVGGASIIGALSIGRGGVLIPGTSALTWLASVSRCKPSHAAMFATAACERLSRCVRPGRSPPVAETPARFDRHRAAKQIGRRRGLKHRAGRYIDSQAV